MKKVLVLGAGLVVRPLTRYLMDHGYAVTVATRTVSKAQQLVAGYRHGTAVQLLMDDQASVAGLVGDHDLTISLVPPPFHPAVARMCLDLGKNLVTTSYIGEPMMSLDAEARDKGLLLLNEIGLDPGIDHMGAMKTIDHVHAHGGRVVSFVSNCGALPAPDSADNPWGYKFSWSPIGVVRAVRNNARYLDDGEVVDVPSEQLFAGCMTTEIEGVGTLEVYPNRDSLGYIELYGIKGVKRMFRGTMRYPSHCAAWTKIAALDLVDETETFDFTGKTLRQAFAESTGLPAVGLEQALAQRLGVTTDDQLFERLEYVGLFGDRPAPAGEGTRCSLFARALEQSLVFTEGQRDMVALQDTFVVEYPDGRRERHVSLLVDYGIPGGDSATSRTVSLPAAIATRMILEGQIDATGVHAPTIPGIYNPVLQGLAERGISMKVTVENL
jgi:saccharopine dehydrogenase-like NADP-dependent oxidoreductase